MLMRMRKTTWNSDMAAGDQSDQYSSSLPVVAVDQSEEYSPSLSAPLLSVGDKFSSYDHLKSRIASYEVEHSVQLLASPSSA